MQVICFWFVEGYYQNYVENNVVKYNFYWFSCGCDCKFDSVWGDNVCLGNVWVN